jgi:hypothetical protein
MSPEATTNLLGVTSLWVVIRPHINHTVAQKLGHDIVNACRLSRRTRWKRYTTEAARACGGENANRKMLMRF